MLTRAMRRAAGRNTGGFGDNTVLFVGSYIEDNRSLCRVAEGLARQGCFRPVFWVYSSGERKRLAEAEVAARGFPLLEVASSAYASTERLMYNPIRMVRELREANRALSLDVLGRVQPVAIVAAGNRRFLTTANEQGVPSLYMQWTEVFDPDWHRVWCRAMERAKDDKLSPLRRVRRKISRRMFRLLGEGTDWVVPGESATRLAVPGEFYRDMYLQAGVAPHKISVTGNPQCDAMHRCSLLTPDQLASFRRRIGLSPEKPYLLFALDDFERSTHLDRRMAEEADATILRAMREALPEYSRVVKLHPKQTSEHAARIRLVDPKVTIVGSELEIGALIAAAAVVVCITSSSLLWAMGIDRPAISAFLWRGAASSRCAALHGCGEGRQLRRAGGGVAAPDERSRAHRGVAGE